MRPWFQIQVPQEKKSFSDLQLVSPLENVLKQPDEDRLFCRREHWRRRGALVRRSGDRVGPVGVQGVLPIADHGLQSLHPHKTCTICIETVTLGQEFSVKTFYSFVVVNDNDYDNT